MKITLLLAILMLNLNAFANEIKVSCTNNIFSNDTLYLTNSLNSWQVSTKPYSGLCSLSRKPQTASSIKDWIKLVPKDTVDNNCFATNYSKPGVERAILELNISPQLIENFKGYIQISLDNRFARYGTKKLTTFFYCQ